MRQEKCRAADVMYRSMVGIDGQVAIAEATGDGPAVRHAGIAQFRLTDAVDGQRATGTGPLEAFGDATGKLGHERAYLIISS